MFGTPVFSLFVILDARDQRKPKGRKPGNEEAVATIIDHATFDKSVTGNMGFLASDLLIQRLIVIELGHNFDLHQDETNCSRTTNSKEEKN